MTFRRVFFRTDRHEDNNVIYKCIRIEKEVECYFWNLFSENVSFFQKGFDIIEREKVFKAQKYSFWVSWHCIDFFRNIFCFTERFPICCFMILVIKHENASFVFFSERKNAFRPKESLFCLFCQIKTNIFQKKIP